MAKKTTFKNRIKEIYVENLFGYYTYTIPKEEFKNLSHPLLIIYGDNGAGKTTILELIFYLLSTVEKAGRKTKIAEIKFSKVNVTLENGIQIIAERSKPMEGSFDFIIREHGKQLYKVPLIADEDCSITLQEQSEKEQSIFIRILKYIENLRISIFFLTDDRKILSSESKEYLGTFRKQLSTPLINRKRQLYEGERFLHEENDALKRAVKNLENWIRKQVIQGARLGERNTNTIYADIVNRITRSRKIITNIDEKALKLKEQLKDIRKRSLNYYKNGLVSRVESKQIEDVLEKTQSEKLQIIYSVIEPYVEGLQARLDSLQKIQELILLFTNSINSYFINKTLEYHLSRGFTIKYIKTNEPINLNMLSSGERQLLLLLCYVITESEEATIFIIDEPEISLNVIWQRKLGDTLLEFAEGRNIQFILATHSIELLTGHRENVCKLINEKEI